MSEPNQGEPSAGRKSADADWEQIVEAVSGSLTKSGFLTSEWYTTVGAAAISAVLALIHINTSTATHVAAVAAPALLAAVYALVRTMHKSTLATLLGDLFPQATTPPPPAGGPAASNSSDG